MSTDVQQLLEQLAVVDRRAAVWCAAQCARTVLHLVEEGEVRPRGAVEAAEAWVGGQATSEMCRSASTAAFAAGMTLERSSAAAAARAAASVAAAPSRSAEADIAVHVAAAASLVLTARANVDPESVEGHARRLCALVASQRWPRTSTPAQLQAASEAVQVAWDAVAGASGDLAMAELVESHARAGRLGLDWSDPAQRAIAERADDEERIRLLLAAGRHGGSP